MWVDPAGIASNYTQEFQFCGGHLDAITGIARPFIHADGRIGADEPKGYICPKNSYCVSTTNPYGGTVNFDDIVHSIELVFVIMTANTFSSLMYFTADSDTIASAWFFIFGIVILAFWLANLLIAVITASFQVIREETSKSNFSNDDISSIHHEEGEVKKGEIKRWYDRTRQFWVVVIVAGICASAYRGANIGPQEARKLGKRRCM